MALAARLDALHQRHEQLDLEITTELKHPGHDEFRVYDLKRQKLRLKDEIEELRHQMEAS